MEIRARFPNLEAYINSFSQYFFVRKTIQDDFDALADQLLPQTGVRGSYTTLIEGTSYTLRFGVHKSLTGCDADINARVKSAKSEYYQILLEAIGAGAAFWKPDLNLNVMFPGHSLQRAVLTEAEFAALAKKGPNNQKVLSDNPPKIVSSFIFCRQQEHNLEGIVEKARPDAAAEMHRLSLEQNYETQMPKGISALIIPMMGKTPCLIKSHAAHREWQQRIAKSQANAVSLEKKLAVAGKMAIKYTPYFSLSSS
jgi:hypothetical protein